MPSFTSNGFKKDKIPEELYSSLLENINYTDIKTEECESITPFVNCMRIKCDGKKGNSISLFVIRIHIHYRCICF